MDCADHCICGDGDTDGAGSDLVHVGVLDEKSVLEFDFQDALSVILCVVYLLFLWAVISLKGKITKKCLEVWNYYRNFASYISKTTNL